MARHTFLGDLASWVMDTGQSSTSTGGLTGDVTLVIPGATVTFYNSASGGTQYTDLLDAGGSAISSVTSDTDGSLPQISGPDGVSAMWADAAGGAGPRRLTTATDLGPVLDSVAAQQSQDQAQIAAMAATAPVYVYYSTATSSYPARPSTGAPVWWVGPVAPIFGGSYAQDGLDYWIGPAS